MRTHPLVVGPALAVLILASGCVTPGTGLYAGPAGVPETAPHEIGDGDTTVTIKVVQEYGAGNATIGAPIVIFEIPKPHQAPSLAELRGRNATLGGRTGPDGILRARLDLGKTYSFLTAVDNWTSEGRHLVKITQEVADKPILITIFKPLGSFETRGSVPIVVRPEAPFVSGLSSSPKFWLTEVRFHPDNVSNRQYLFRMRSFQGALTYTPPPGTQSNLQVRAVLFSDNAEPMQFGGSFSSVVMAPGVQTKPIMLYPVDIANIHALKNPILKIGAMTYESVLGAQCVPYEIKVEATFDSTPLPPPRRPYYGMGKDNTIAQAPIAC